MRDLVLALLIVVASQSPAPAGPVMPNVPSTYPAPGVFCGMMTLCTPKATQPVPRRPKAGQTGG